MNKNEWIGKNNKAIAPLRVSSNGQEGNTSWLTQKRDCEEYCRKHGLELVDTVQIVESASKSELRTKFKEVLKQAFKKNIHHVLFHKTDRESRNLTDNEANETLVRQGKIVIHYVAEDKRLYKNSPDSDFLMRDYHAVQNKHYSRDLSTKVRKSAQMKAESGWWPGCRPPEGYLHQKLKSEKGFEKRRGTIIVIDSNTQNVKRIQREFELRAEHPTPTYIQIRNRIIAEGLVPKEQIKNYYPGNIQRRLENIFYDGRFTWNGIEYKGKHERIISESLFWKVQATFGKKNPFRKNPNALFGHGWIKCANPDCGCSIIYDPKVKKIKSTGEEKLFKYYRCSNGKHVHQSLKGMAITEESMMSQLGESVKQISIREDFKDELLNAVNETLVKMKRATKDDLDRFEAALNGIKNKEDQAYDHFSSEVIDLETYNRQRKRFQDEQLQYTNMMKQAQLAINDTAGETVKSIIELANNAESLWIHMSHDERRLLLEKLLSNRVLDGVTVRYEIVKPLRILSEMIGNQNWRSGWDLNPRYLFCKYESLAKTWFQPLTHHSAR